MLTNRMTIHDKKRQHLKSPIPFPLEITPLGKTLTNGEWDHFCKDHLTSKDMECCQRRKNGKLLFLGEGGMDAVITFQKKFKDRFHLRMICANQKFAIEGIRLATQKALDIHEVHYKNGHRETLRLSDQRKILKLIESI